MGEISVDGTAVEIKVGERASVAHAFELVRERIQRDGRIITSVRIDGNEVTWNDGSAAWNRPVEDVSGLDVVSDYAIRVTDPLLDRVTATLPQLAREHRQLADQLRADPAGAAASAGTFLTIWTELTQVVEQVSILHGIDLSSEEWSACHGRFQELFGKLGESLKEFKEALEVGDFVLSADLLEFEFAPLAEAFVEPFRTFRAALQQRFPEGA